MRTLLTMLFCAALLAGCTPIIAGYSLEAYTNATRLKVETLELVSKGAEPYAAHAGEAEVLRIKLRSAYEFSRGTPYNVMATKTWERIGAPGEANTIVGRFFEEWQVRPYSPAFLAEKRNIIAIAFDRLICLEANKKEATRCPPLEGGQPPATGAADTGEEAIHG